MSEGIFFKHNGGTYIYTVLSPDSDGKSRVCLFNQENINNELLHIYVVRTNISNEDIEESLIQELLKA